MPYSGSDQMFSRPENDARVMDSWQRFLTGSDAGVDAGSDALRRLIDDSWRRCLEASVDPGRDQAPPPLPEHSLYSLRSEYGELLSASTPVMAQARNFLSESGTVMVLTDPRGTIMNVEGDAALRSAAENVHLLPGANWSEFACGTNAIGTALELGQPVQIHSAEHFCAGIKRWSCSAMVICDPYDKRVVGVVDVSGLNSSYTRHSLALAVSTAARIENRLAKIEMELRYQLLEQCVQRLSASTSDGVIVFDRRGHAIKANERVAYVLAELGVQGWSMGSDGQRGAPIGKGEGKELPCTMPEWMRPEWLEPVVLDGQRIGTVLTLPGRRASVSLRGTLAADSTDKEGFERVVGESPGVLEAIAKARQLARSRVPVLLLGETGVGKDVFARAIHGSGPTKGAPFIALNCGGFSRELLTSELFGYAEGAFTGARRGGMMGKIEAADGGTLFLDEIGEMPLDLQPHFLRVLEEGEVYRLGENKPRKVNFRLIAATNRDLRKEVEEGRFRMDLFYRVAVTSIRIPALRERTGDIPALAEHYLAQLSAHHGMDTPVLTPRALEALRCYAWPGNIRELRNVMESMLLTGWDGILGEDQLPAEIRAGAPATFALPPGSVGEAPGALTALEQAEREAMLRALRECRGNMTAVARELGIAKSTVYAKLRRFGLEDVVGGLRSNTL